MLVAKIMSQAKRPLKDTALINRPPWSSGNRLKELRFTVFTRSGELTKYIRFRLERPNNQALAAVCVGPVDVIKLWENKPILHNKPYGQGFNQRSGVKASVFFRGYLTKEKRIHGILSGDLMTVDCPTGKYQGKYSGKVVVRASGYLKAITPNTLKTISLNYGNLLKKNVGSEYPLNFSAPISPLGLIL
jgi:hypothetical protein